MSQLRSCISRMVFIVIVVYLLGEQGICQEVRTVFTIPSRDLAYQKLPPSIDVECRTREWDQSDPFDMASLEGMPREFSRAAQNYLEEVIRAVNGTFPRRKRFRHVVRDTGVQYPMHHDAVYAGEVPVVFILLPRPNTVDRWIRSSEKPDRGCLSMEQAFGKSRSVYGRTVIFAPGAESLNPTVGLPVPHGENVPFAIQSHGNRVLSSGKCVAAPRYGNESTLWDITSMLRLDTKGGGRLIAQYVTVPVSVRNQRLRWTSIETENIKRQFLAYAIIDGNGAARKNRPEESVSFVRPLKCKTHAPTDGKHERLLLPTPIAWPPTFGEAWDYNAGTPHEDWCLDDWFPAQADACWVVREAEDSKPLQESFLLIPAREKSDRPLFCIAAFFETGPKQLIEELAPLFGSSPDAVLNSSETMLVLTALYEKMRDIPLSD